MFDIESRGPAYALARSPPWLPDYDITEKAISSLLLILLFILIQSRCKVNYLSQSHLSSELFE